MLNKNFYKKSLLTTLIIVSAMSYAPMGYAALASYSQNFESLNGISSTALSDAGFVIYENSYNNQSLTNPVNSAGPMQARNDYRGFANVVTGQGNSAQGTQQLKIFSNYPSPYQKSNYVDALTLQQQTIGADDLGTTWTFSFDTKQGDITGTSSASAWIRAIDGGNILAEDKLDTTSRGFNWESYSVSLYIDPTWNGKTLEFGVNSAATAYTMSGVYYDNFSLAGTPAVPVPAAAWLFGSGLLGLIGVARRRKS